MGTCPLPTIAPATPPAALVNALNALRLHLAGTTLLTETQLVDHRTAIFSNAQFLGANAQILGQAIALVKQYETVEGPMFINEATKGGFPRSGGLAIHRAIYSVQQGLLDHAYSKNNNVERFEATVKGGGFRTANYFPGAIKAGADLNQTHTAKINASQPTFEGKPVQFHDLPARRPTGTYLPPGQVAVVTVPDALVNKGFSIRVGAHSWDLANKNEISRMDRVSMTYPITCKWTRITHPLGGGIYIDVPYEARAGVVDVQISNIVRSPFFATRRFAASTTPQQWELERNYPAPWADFESDKFMMQVPSPWLTNVNDPWKTMNDWDLAMDAYSELFGVALLRPKTVLYLQIDTLFRGTANFPGYPQSNYPYNPANTGATTNPHRWILQGPRQADWATLHELGHAHTFTKFPGEVESAVNLPYVAVMNRKFGATLDRAFGGSVSDWKHITLDDAATMWLVTANFRAGRPMNITNMEGDEVKYQHRGHGKYVAIAKLFGWEALHRFWESVNEDYLRGIEYPQNTDPIDSRIRRMSRAAGVDLTPLIHFWGVQPVNGTALASAIASDNLRRSAVIYDELQRYKTLIPMTNAEFLEHAKRIYPGGLKEGQSPLYGVGWYFVTAPVYSQADGQAAQAALQAIINRYFPNGRPPQ